MPAKADAEAFKVQPPQQQGYGQAVKEIKDAMEANAEQYYSPEAMKNHQCLGEGCGVCQALSGEYRKGVIQGARMGAKYPQVDWGQVE